ncbi:type I restriction endonuclease subunit R [Veillonella caviae]|uniref:type I restriction endonuclease subunit R n=1 Tax=Veillonella caviae TaxID=248316 RepID=UPI0023F6F7E9|nr:type I restriction endonuclease [Veillonella caviae]
MSEFDVKERRFEDDIVTYLCNEGGYVQGDPREFNRELALDTDTLLAFIKRSQPKKWERFVKIYGTSPEKQFFKRFSESVEHKGLLHVLRNGFVDRGVNFKVVFWKPETSMNELAQQQYNANILHCTRQLHYSLRNENSVDIVLFVNGIPVVSMELKCQFTGQDTTNAISQYKFDRSNRDAIFAFNRRVLAHFAVDLTHVYMTTKLQGDSTYFLPFNQGSNGAGRVGGAGNPINVNGIDTAYLWEEVLQKDRLLEILQKYLHLSVTRDEHGNVKDERLIFPRFHQLDVVTKLLAHVKAHGAGHNYLIQHSAGSGKSNSIAWLAHRLSGLHNDSDEKIFQSTIIVTDRKVLDSQLQNTVSQFDHTPGVVKKVDKTAQQLREAIESGTPIIITTLQKFPVIYQEVKAQRKRFAIIVDEAHSSQTGSAARKLKQALADTEEALKEYAELAYEDEAKELDGEDKLVKELIAQGMHDNLSFFAFTATPKEKTLQMFGMPDAADQYHPFHIYSMQQAIEEGFILDVLKQYMSYNMYYKIATTVDVDEELDTAAGMKAIRKFQTLHPHNIGQKTAVMIRHFLEVTRHKIGGRAKAMIVTASRQHAVRYVVEFRRQLQQMGIADLEVLVAFSGEITDKGETYTEESLNRDKDGNPIKEKSLPSTFHNDEYGMLIVAEKYQTGFDEPLLHTMFVDKKLSGVKAVQTLSRLNRTMKGKTDTFVLDFVNSPEDILASFAPFYQETTLEKETDPNTLYDVQSTLQGFHVFDELDIVKFGELFFQSKEQSIGDIGKLQSYIVPAIKRYEALSEEEQDTFKGTLQHFNRLYSFITQVCRLFDKELHVFSVYAKFIEKQLPKSHQDKIELDDKLMLEYYRLEKGEVTSLILEPGGEGLQPITGKVGRSTTKVEPFRELVDKINQRFGTAFTAMDKVFLQLEQDIVKDKQLKDIALTKNFDLFMLVFAEEFKKLAAKRHRDNDTFFKLLFSDEELFKAIQTQIGSTVFRRFEEGVYYYGLPEHGTFSYEKGPHGNQMVAEEKKK